MWAIARRQSYFMVRMNSTNPPNNERDLYPLPWDDDSQTQSPDNEDLSLEEADKIATEKWKKIQASS